ncbi:hypothetical protein [Aeromonas aquatica]|uniref:hypothetical protein n=1 Tax=Aeromonas aquatica TaxID=558964 RepID=UPI00286F4FB2|nr:hypothetical protein [Aeromonas aquatica]
MEVLHPDFYKNEQYKNSVRREALRQELKHAVNDQLTGVVDRVRAFGYWETLLPALAANDDMDILASVLADRLTHPNGAYLEKMFR